MTDLKYKTMEAAGFILDYIFEVIAPRIVSGCVLKDIDFLVGKLLDNAEAKSALKMQGFPGNISICIDNQVIQGAPDDRVIKPGDLVSLDMTMFYKGFFVDKAKTVCIEPVPYDKAFVRFVSEACLQQAFNMLRPEVAVADVGYAIASTALQYGLRPGYEFSGHGIGEDPHMFPIIPNCSNAIGHLHEGMFITLEPIIFWRDYRLDYTDKFLISADMLNAHSEETIYIDKDRGKWITC